MKRFLFAGEGYALSRTKLKSHSRSFSKAFATLFLVLLCSVVREANAAWAVETGGAAQTGRYSAQQLILTGTVVDQDGRPIEGVTVSVRGGSAAATTSTDADGRFTLTTAQQRGVLMISFLGHEPVTQRFDAENIGPFHFMLQPVDARLEEVEVSTGYQRIPRERATGSFVFIDSALLNRSVSTDIISRLKGVTPSLLFDERAGGEPKLSIRGRSTIFANADPLIVVDNFPYEGDINNINPNDVESVTILRDAAAASIWGVRAGNGVIVITTKQGKVGQPMQVSLNTNATIGGKPDQYYLPRISSEDQVDLEEFLYEQGLYTSTLNNEVTYPVVSPVVEILADPQLSDMEKRSRLDAMKALDIREDIDRYYYRPRFTQQYGLNVRGSSTRHRYYISGGYDDNQASVKGNQGQRVNLGAQNTFILVPRLEMGVGLYFTQRLLRTDQTLGVLSSAYPYEQLADREGTFLPIAYGFRSSFIEQAAHEGRLDWQYVPLEETQHRSNRTRVSNYRFNAQVGYLVLPGLGIDAYYQYEQQSSHQDQLYGEESYYVRNAVNRFASVANGELKYNLPLGSILHRNETGLGVHNGRAVLNFRRQIGYGQWNVIAGVEVRQATTHGYRSGYFGYDPENGTTSSVNLDSSYVQYPSGRQRISAFANQGINGYLERFRSMFFNGAYYYRERYTLSASARVDQTNLFGVKANQRSVPLWSVGFKWDLDKEPFYRLDALRSLSVRSSYGFNGNFDETAKAYVTAIYSTNQYRLREARLDALPNPALTGERTAVLNVGMDFESKTGAWSGRLDHYRRWGNNLIATRPIDPTTGKSSFRGNVANMEGWGWDFELMARHLFGRFQLKNTFYFSTNRDKVTELMEPGTSYFNDASLLGNTYAAAVGKPLFGVYSYSWGGLDPQTGDPQGYLDGEVSKDYTAIQSNVQSVDDLVFHGTYVPLHTGAWRPEFVYRNVSLSFNITYKLNYYFRRVSMITAGMLSGGPIKFPDYANRWQQPGDENLTDVPSFVYPVATARANFYQNSSVLIERGDHLRMQDLRLTYMHPKFTAYAHVGNLGILWRANRHGIDPDYNSNEAATVGGLVSGVIPPARTIALGLQLSF